MQIRLAEIQDIEDILEIYRLARQFMVENGNLEQWKNNYPPREVIEKDINERHSYVCVDENEIVGVFFYNKMEDPTYLVIDGEWINHEEYGVVHRIASKMGRKGVASFCLQWAFEQCGNLKIDTHDDNIPMQSLLKKHGFQYCGTIKLLDGNPRRAYQKV